MVLELYVMDWINALPGVRPLWHWVKSRMHLNRKHDVAIFKKLDAIADESRVDEILNRSIYTSHFHFEEHDVLRQFINALQRIENQYLESVIRLKAEQLAWEMGGLLSFVGQTFWSVPAGHLTFHPDPIDPEVYDAERKQLNEKLEKAWDAYKTYRTVVNERLRV